MSALEVVLLICAGVLGGLSGSIAGLASLVSYPALLAVGLGPIGANVTNTVALVFSTLGATLGSRPELEGQAARLRPLGVAGAVRWRGGGDAVAAHAVGHVRADRAVADRRRVAGDPGATARASRAPARGTGAGLVAGVFLIAIYGGYFGAAAGVMVLALMLVATGESLARSNAFKNVVLGIANATAAIAFGLLGPVHWAAAAPLAVGLFAGGRLGPVVVRRSNATVLRILIGVAGLTLAVKLGLDAYR